MWLVLRGNQRQTHPSGRSPDIHKYTQNLHPGLFLFCFHGLLRPQSCAIPRRQDVLHMQRHLDGGPFRRVLPRLQQAAHISIGLPQNATRGETSGFSRFSPPLLFLFLLVFCSSPVFRAACRGRLLGTMEVRKRPFSSWTNSNHHFHLEMQICPAPPKTTQPCGLRRGPS